MSDWHKPPIVMLYPKFKISALYLQNRVLFLLAQHLSFLFLLILAPWFSWDTICLHSWSMETLRVHRTCHDIQSVPLSRPVTGPGMGVWARPGHWGFIVGLCWAVTKEFATCKGYKPRAARDLHREETHLENGVVNRDGHRVETWAERFDDIPSAPQSTNSWIPEPLPDLRKLINRFPLPSSFSLFWVSLNWAFCHLYLKKNLDYCADDYIVSYLLI